MAVRDAITPAAMAATADGARMRVRMRMRVIMKGIVLRRVYMVSGTLLEEGKSATLAKSAMILAGNCAAFPGALGVVATRVAGQQENGS